MTDDSKLPGALAFMQQLWGLAHALDAASKKMHATVGVTGPQRLAVRLVGLDPGVTAGEVAARMRLHPSTLTGIFRRLEQAGFVRRRADREDRRRVRFELTASGKRVNDLKSGTIEARVRRALAKLSAAEMAAMERALAILTDELLDE